MDTRTSSPPATLDRAASIALLERLRLPVEPTGIPDTEDARRGTAAWMDQHDLIRDAAASRYLDSVRLDLYTAHTAPSLRGAALTEANFWTVWTTIVDDWLDIDDPPLVRQRAQPLIELLEQDDPDRTGPRPHPYLLALSDLWKRMQTRPHIWRRQLASGYVQFVESMILESEYRTQGRWPSVGRYCEIRSGTIGSQPFYMALEGLQGIFLPPRVANSSEVLSFSATSALCLAMVNDLVGIDRDHAKGDHLNLVLVVEHEYRCTRQEAIDIVLEMFQDRISHLLRIKQRFPQLISELDGNQADLELLQAVGHSRLVAIAGIRNWSVASYRYAEGFDQKMTHPH